GGGAERQGGGERVREDVIRLSRKVDTSMTTAELAERVVTLENTVADLKAQLTRMAGASRPWWRANAGRFADDPVFDEIVRLGQQYRKAQRPKRRKPKRDRP